MDTLLVILLIGISLSMDAFSLAIIYGTYGLGKRNEIILSIIVGLFHFFMPLIGLCVGSVISNFFMFSIHFVVGVIFGIIGISMFFSSYKEEDNKIFINFGSFLLFGFSVSIDSLTTGIGLSLISRNYLLVSIIFMSISSMFTFMGLRFGRMLNQRFGKYANVLGGIIMIMLSFYYLFFK